MARIEAIKELNISLKKSIASIILKDKSTLNIKDYKNAVEKSGFSVREIKISADGEIVRYNNSLALKVNGTKQLFILSDAKELEIGTKVSIKGNVHEHAEDKPSGLLIEKIELIEK